MRLLFTRRFGPYWLSQLGLDLNDNFLRSALVFKITYSLATEKSAGLLVNLATGLFLLPLCLASPIAGSLADRYEKQQVLRWLKASEVGLAILATAALAIDSITVLFCCLVLMGIRTALFMPIKYGIIPELVRRDELVASNSWVGSTTVFAAMTGVILGGLLVNRAPVQLGITILAVAVVGLVASFGVPKLTAASPNLALSWSLRRQATSLFKLSERIHSVFLSVLGIAWFWFLCAIILTQMPTFVRFAINGSETVAILLGALFAISFALGSWLCRKLSGEEVELALVAFGAAGLSLALWYLGFGDGHQESSVFHSTEDFLTASLMLTRATGISLAVVLLGLSTSFFVIPLHAFVQQRTPAEERARVISANTMVDAIFLAFAAAFGLVVYQLGGSVLWIFHLVAVLNILVTLYIFLVIPEFMMRFVIWVLASTVYRVRVFGREKIPQRGACILVANHVSFIDWFILTVVSRRPARFVMYYKYFYMPILTHFFRLAKAIPIAGGREDEAIKQRAFDEIRAALSGGDLVCIFPEGAITHDGKMIRFHPGVERILAESPVPVIPVALRGLWGSFFSRKGGRGLWKIPKPSRRIIIIAVGDPIEPSHATAALLQEEVQRLHDVPV